MRSVMASISLAAVLSASFAGAGCTTYHDQLARSQKAFEVSEYERALALLTDLDEDVTRLSDNERAQYRYMRGMSHYRIGQRVEARHWLALAKAQEETTHGALPADWMNRTNEALAEMNKSVFDGGISALAASTGPSDGDASANGANGSSTATPAGSGSGAPSAAPPR